MAGLHDILAGGFWLLLAPAVPFGLLAGLVLVSAVAGVVLLFAFRATSNPKAIRAARSRVQGHLLAIRIYRDDLGVVFRSQARLLGALGGYMARMVVPFLAILVPFALLFAHLDARYASRALRPGERALVKVDVDAVDGWRLEGDDGVEVESPPVRIPSRKEVDWRIRALLPGTHRVTLVRSGERIEKRVEISAEPAGASPRRGSGFEALFLAPTEPVIAVDGVREIEVVYPPLRFPLLGWDLHWIVVFLAVSVAVALLLRKRVGVEF